MNIENVLLWLKMLTEKSQDSQIIKPYFGAASNKNNVNPTIQWAEFNKIIKARDRYQAKILIKIDIM